MGVSSSSITSMKPANYFGHVILDFQPQTRSHERIVKAYQPEETPDVKDLLNQHFNLMNPYGAELARIKRNMDEMLKDPSISDHQKAAEHVEMMNDFKIQMQKYRNTEGAVPRQVQMPPQATVPQETPAKSYVQHYDASQPAAPVQSALKVQQDPTIAATPNIEPTVFPTPPLSHRPPGLPELQERDLEPWEVPLLSSDDSSDSDDDDRYPVDARPLSYSDTESERKSKIRYIKKMKKQPPPPPPFIDDKDTDPRPLSYSDTENERERKLNYQKKYPIRKKMKIPKYKF